MNTTIIDLRIFDDHPEALAKITEAIAKAYFDNCLKKDFDIQPLSTAYKTAFNLCPNYRLLLKDKPGFEKYKDYGKDPQMAEITSLPIYSYSQKQKTSACTLRRLLGRLIANFLTASCG